MKPETLKNISAILRGELTEPDAENVYIGGISVDSRSIKPGELFFALRAERDGHLFIPDAYEKGASAAVVERKIDNPIPQIIVNNTLDALGKLAKNYREAINPRVIGITGSVGKTSTRQMIAAVLRSRYRLHSAKKNYNNLIGLPLTILEMPENTEIAVLEFGINRIGEMEKLVEIAEPDIAVITEIANVHTEGLKDMENIVQEKLKILSKMKQDEPVFINKDNAMLYEKTEKIHPTMITYGIENPADFRAREISFEQGKSSFKVDGLKVKLNLLGRAPIYSALSAIAVGEYLGIPPVIIAELLESLKPQPHRMELVQIAGVNIIDDSYNSSPIALYEAFKTLDMIYSKRKLVVIGDMLELGEYTEKYHREAGEWIVEFGFDGAIFFGPSMMLAAQTAQNKGYEKQFLATQIFDDAMDFLKEKINTGDTILIKGSHGMEMIRFVQELKKWLSEQK